MSTREQQIARFWSNYLAKLEKAQVRQDRRRWYVLRAERLLEAIQPRRLGQLSAQEVTQYLSESGRDTSLAARQFLQIVDAIRILGLTVGAPWVETVDWGHWRASARTLAPDHPTVARDYGPEVAGLEPAGPMTNLAAVRDSVLISRAHVRGQYAVLVAEAPQALVDARVSECASGDHGEMLALGADDGL